MNSQTREFNLLSGVKTVIRRMQGEAQEILSRQGDAEKKNKDLNEILALYTVSIGSKTDISIKDIENLLIFDRKHLLVELRQFTLGDPTVFIFNYTWSLASRQKFQEKIEWNLEGMFEKRNYKKVVETSIIEDEKPIKGLKIMDMNFSEYSEVIENKQYEITLTISGKTVRLTMPNHIEQTKWQKIEQSKITSHSELMMRIPVYVEEISGKEQLISVDLNRMEYLDIEQVRQSITLMEGSMDTIIPLECERQPGLKASIDLTAESTFFYPSRAI